MLLQSIDLLPEREVVAISMSRHRHRAGAPIEPGSRPGSILVPADTRLTFDRYLSAFFESYWHRYGELRNYALVMTLHGSATLTVHRQSDDGELHVVERRRYDTAEPTEIRVDLSTDLTRGGPGRVWFVIDTDSTVELADAGWHTDATPVRDVALNVVFCTFNREDYLSQVLADLARSPQVIERIARFTVVNQGNPFDLEALGGARWPAAFADKVVIVEQDNLGGCGGFSRGMLETLRADDLSHVVLLDDDIRIDPDSLLRAQAFLSFAHDDVAVGGHMLNLDRPTTLYESGADIHPGTLEPRPINHGLVLGDDGALEPFLDARTCDYNGWWFFAISTDLIDRHGLPMPCFIRGDDIEYGIRLARQGSRTVAVPGIAVWHEPFYLKLGGWQLYFEVRNRLTMATLHGIGDWNAFRRSFTKTFVRDLVMSRYHSCALMLEAIADFEAGPDACFTTTPDALKRCISIVAELGPTRVDNDQPTRRPERPPHMGKARKLATRGAKASQLSTVLARRLRSGPTEIDEQPYAPGSLRIVDIARLASYQVRESDGVTWRYTYDGDIERDLFKRFTTAMRALAPNEALLAAAPTGPGAWRAEWEAMFPDGI
jgi:galactofuranosylgalactofuranosylrhamnosyl-N-acetylglucosaminyl-diphospho-decaprenol beta-1,5/1,6-galactofuranosyltransferase